MKRGVKQMKRSRTDSDASSDDQVDEKELKLMI